LSSSTPLADCGPPLFNTVTHMQFFYCTIVGLNNSVFQDVVLAFMLSCVSVYTAIVYVPKVQIFVSLVW